MNNKKILTSMAAALMSAAAWHKLQPFRAQKVTEDT